MRRKTIMSKTSKRILSLVCVSLLCAAGTVGADSAGAAVTIRQFSVSPSTTQAGGHPNIRTFLFVTNRFSIGIPPPSCDCQDAKNVRVHFPPGVIGSQHATPQCTAADFGNLRCPSDSQIGITRVGIGDEDPTTVGGFGGVKLAVFNLVPHPGQAGLLAVNIPLVNFPIYIVISARTGGDFGLDATLTNITHVIPLAFSDLELWGVPAAASNTPLRHPAGCDPFFENPPCYPGVPSNSPEVPFLSNATTCGVSLSTAIEVVSYDKEVTEAESPYPATTGCDQLSFNPSLFAQPTTTQSDSASGLEVDLKVPQDESPTVPSPSEIRATTVTLPPGFSINPNAADGKTACTDTEARFGTEEEAECPEDAKIGTVTVFNSTLPGPLPGYIYIGKPLPEDRYRIFLTANGFATHVKLAGSIEPDPQTGQVVTKFTDLPQTPFSDFNLHFFGSERGLLATPTQCGTYAVTSTFTPWDSLLPVQTSAQFFSLDAGPGGAPCPPASRPFSPTMRAGVSDNTAGSHSSFALQLTRPDGDQNLAGLTVSTPPGLSATLAGIPYCSDADLAAAAQPSYSGFAEQASPRCPAASQIGISTTGAGAGTHPVHLPGNVYLAGPYNGAPLSLAVITPAVSGPYDLGNVVVRAALKVDPTTAQITAVSDPLPQILQGIPLRLRSILITLNRPGFTLNPTNCDRTSVKATIGGDQGAQAKLAPPFQVASCADLPYGPKLSLKLTGGLNRLGHPAIHSTFSAGPGESNTRLVSVALPPGELLDQSHIGTVCKRPDFAAGKCPSGSLIGTAEATTPLLENPLEGNVYLRSNPNGGLPDLVADLKGQVDFELSGQVAATKSGALRTTFQTVPDAPVSSFKLDLLGGSKGLLQNSEGLCGRSHRASVKMIGQNGVVRNTSPKLQVSCGSKPRHKGHHRRHSLSGRRAER
jgi:hypothetical protein